MSSLLSRRQFGITSLALGSSLLARRSQAQHYRPYAPVIPGTGIRVVRTGDDFEAEDWEYYPQLPKSSWNIDDQVREPGSMSRNGLWVEGAKRGTPDSVRRITTPEGGLEGSKGCMVIQSLYSGTPRKLTYEPQQDDLLHNSQAMVGNIPVTWSPNCICRVYVPPTRLWEQRDGATFGFRTGLIAQQMTRRKKKEEEYWPGIFLHMERTAKEGKTAHQVRAWIRADNDSRDVPSLTFEPETWITMGISHTPDGAVHFFLRRGVETLTSNDCVGSYWCYGYQAEMFQTFFFNVINTDDGRSISTPWIVDDAYLFAATPPASKIRMAGGQKPVPPQAGTSEQPATR